MNKLVRIGNAAFDLDRVAAVDGDRVVFTDGKEIRVSRKAAEGLLTEIERRAESSKTESPR